jgi:DNA-binding Lrp family transcriptional regulator
MENIFAEMPPEINSSVYENILLKLKRRAFIFINAEDDSSHLALEDLRKLDEVEEVYLARGVYDLVAKVSGESLDDLREDVLKRIRSISSIKSVLTLTIV